MCIDSTVLSATYICFPFHSECVTGGRMQFMQYICICTSCCKVIDTITTFIFDTEKKFSRSNFVAIT